MKRKASGEVIAAIFLLAVTGTIMAVVVSSSSYHVSSDQDTVSESIKMSTQRVRELVSVIDITKNPDSTAIELINYGVTEIPIKSVMVDGKESPYTIKTHDENQLSKLPVREIVMIEVPTSGDSVQIQTTAGNIFDFAT